MAGNKKQQVNYFGVKCTSSRIWVPVEVFIRRCLCFRRPINRTAFGAPRPQKHISVSVRLSSVTPFIQSFAPKGVFEHEMQAVSGAVSAGCLVRGLAKGGLSVASSWIVEYAVHRLGSMPRTEEFTVNFIGTIVFSCGQIYRTVEGTRYLFPQAATWASVSKTCGGVWRVCVRRGWPNVRCSWVYETPPWAGLRPKRRSTTSCFSGYGLCLPRHSYRLLQETETELGRIRQPRRLREPYLGFGCGAVGRLHHRARPDDSAPAGMSAALSAGTRRRD